MVSFNNPRHLRTLTYSLRRGRDMHIYPWPNNNCAELHIIRFRSAGETIVYLLNPPQRFCFYLSSVCLEDLSFLHAIFVFLQRQANQYSYRLDWIWGVVFKLYGDDWRLHRRLLWRFFQPNTIMQWQSTQTREARHLLLCLLEDSSDLKNLIKL